jgi:hypothetical protein
MRIWVDESRSLRREERAREDRRRAFNRGVRAAAHLARDCWDWGTTHREQAERTADAILKLLKPKPKRSAKKNTTA